MLLSSFSDILSFRSFSGILLCRYRITIIKPESRKIKKWMPRIFSLKRLTLYLGGTSAPSVKGDQALPFLTGTWCRSEMALLAGHHECHVTRCVLTAAAVFVHLGAFDFSADYWLRFDLQGVVSQYTALGF